MVSLAELVVSVERRVINPSLSQVINPGNCDDGEAADGIVDCCVVDVRPVVGLDGK